MGLLDGIPSPEVPLRLRLNSPVNDPGLFSRSAYTTIPCLPECQAISKKSPFSLFCSLFSSPARGRKSRQRGPVWQRRAPTGRAGRRGRRGWQPAAGGSGGPVPVVTAKVQTKSIPVTIPAVGTAEALQTVQIRAQTTGQLSAVCTCGKGRQSGKRAGSRSSPSTYGRSRRRSHRPKPCWPATPRRRTTPNARRRPTRISSSAGSSRAISMKRSGRATTRCRRRSRPIAPRSTTRS